MAEKPKAHASGKKKEQVKQIEQLLKEYPVIGIIDMSTLPCAQLQSIRIKLKNQMRIYMTKKRLIKLAIENAKKDVKGLEKLEEQLKGIPALMFTKENPFKIFSIIKKNKTPAAAKAGQIAPRDLIIPAGPTEFGPGPIVGELGSLGIKAGIENGKVAIKVDFVAAKKGDPIKEKVIGLLAKFGIKPMEIGLNVTAVFENGSVLTSEILDIDESKYEQDIMAAASWAFNLSVEAAFVTKDNADTLIAKAFREAKFLAVEQGILSKEVVEEVLARVSAQAASLKNELNI
jgi:large subunit ribosomal protein L10